MELQEIKRTGWNRSCPFCGEHFVYTVINNQQPPTPFFYAENANDILLRKSDKEQVDNIYQSAANGNPTDEALERLWKSILGSAPNAPKGGKFGFWTNFKCPNCNKEFPYNNNVKDIKLRMYEPKIVVVDKAILLGDTAAESYLVRVTAK